MGAYQPLFTVSVDHRYFADGLWKGLDFIPEPGTLKLIQCANALLRNTQNGIAVYYDSGKLNALRLYAEDANGVSSFSFKVYARDRGFANYTSPSFQKDGAILYFSNRGRDGNAAGEKTRLSADDFVSDKDFEDVSALNARGILCGKDRVMPDFLVDILVEPAKSGGLDAREYEVSFNTRQSYLKYHLLGSVNRDNLFIVDLDNRFEFEFCGDVMLPGNRPSKVFRSKELIPVLEKSPSRFQLREQGQGSGKVLIKRLPVPSESRLGMELINGRNEIVSENFINF